MACCQPAIDRQFSEAVARRDLDRYRRKGPGVTTRLIIEAVKGRLPDGATLLDIGGGVGVIHHELLDDGVAAAVQVEPATAYLEAARDEARRLGHEGRVRFVPGDLTEVSGELEDADVVTLDRVICCYPDMESLVLEAARKARGVLAASYPRDGWPVRAAIGLQNFGRRLVGNPFRTYAHPISRIEEVLAASGFTMVSVAETLVWRVVAFTP